jgi:hypothetical protein
VGEEPSLLLAPRVEQLANLVGREEIRLLLIDGAESEGLFETRSVFIVLTLRLSEETLRLAFVERDHVSPLVGKAE